MKNECKIGACRFTFETAKLDEFGLVINESRKNYGNHKNLVLNQGLSALLVGSTANLFVLGESNTPVVRTQTSLISPIPAGYGQFSAGSSGSYTTGTDENGDFIEWSGTGQSAAFTANHNIAELGFGGVASQPWSRALTRNSEGVPTAITVLVGEVVILTYKFRIYYPAGTATGTITVTTDGVPAVHNWSSSARAGQLLALGGPSGLSLLTIHNQIFVGATARTFTASGSPAMIESGASVSSVWQKNAGSGALSVTSILSNTAINRTMPVNIIISPAIVVTNDQRTVFGITQYLTQDYS